MAQRAHFGNLQNPTRPSAAADPGRRARVASQATPSQLRGPAPLRAGRQRERAVTLAGVGRGSGGPQAGVWDPSEPVLLEMQKGLLGGAGTAVNTFRELDRQIRKFCDDSSEYIGSYKQLPRARFGPTAADSSAVGKPAFEFSSTEEYAFFVLLSIVNSLVYERIFVPFHPAVSAEDNDLYGLTYEDKANNDLQVNVGAWRSKTFRDADAKSAAGKAALFRQIAGEIETQFTSALQVLPPTGESLPSFFHPRLRAILEAAYQWNRVAKIEIVKYDFEPYIVDPLSPWDPERMECFERIRTPTRNGTPIISPVSLGLIGSVALGGRRVSHVQQQAKVLVEEWFRDSAGSRARTMSTAARGSTRTNPSRAQSSQAAQIVTKQPAATPQMTPAAPPPRSQAQVLPPPEKKKGCC